MVILLPDQMHIFAHNGSPGPAFFCEQCILPAAAIPAFRRNGWWLYGRPYFPFLGIKALSKVPMPNEHFVVVVIRGGCGMACSILHAAHRNAI